MDDWFFVEICRKKFGWRFSNRPTFPLSLEYSSMIIRFLKFREENNDTRLIIVSQKIIHLVKRSSFDMFVDIGTANQRKNKFLLSELSWISLSRLLRLEHYTVSFIRIFRSYEAKSVRARWMAKHYYTCLLAKNSYTIAFLWQYDIVHDALR